VVDVIFRPSADGTSWPLMGLVDFSKYSGPPVFADVLAFPLKGWIYSQGVYFPPKGRRSMDCTTLQHTATHCNTLQHTATHCNTLQHTATHDTGAFVTSCVLELYCNTLQHTATLCNTMQHTATHCNTLQHTSGAFVTSCVLVLYCNILQHTATQFNILQHTTPERS